MKQRQQKDIQSNQWYQFITDLPLSRFIDVAVNGNLHALTISGDPSLEELSLAWADIHIQYADAMGNAAHKLFTTLFAEVTILAITYKQIQTLIEVLGMACTWGIYHKQLYAELNILLNTSFVFSETDIAGNLELLKRCYNRSKGIKLRFDLKQSQLDALEAKEPSKAGTINKEYFTSILITLSDHAYFPVSTEITVYEFCERTRRYNQYIDSLTSSKKPKHGSK